MIGAAQREKLTNLHLFEVRSAKKHLSDPFLRRPISKSTLLRWEARKKKHLLGQIWIGPLLEQTRVLLRVAQALLDVKDPHVSHRDPYRNLQHRRYWYDPAHPRDLPHIAKHL